MLRETGAILAATILLGACETPPEPTRFEKACSAVVGAFQDAVVPIAVQDCATGQVRGSKDGIEVRASLRTLPDGAVRVEFHTSGQNQALIHRISQAYDARMGR